MILQKKSCTTFINDVLLLSQRFLRLILILYIPFILKLFNIQVESIKYVTFYHSTILSTISNLFIAQRIYRVCPGSSP